MRSLDSGVLLQGFSKWLFPFEMVFVVRDAIFYRDDGYQREKQKIWDTPASSEV